MKIVTVVGARPQFIKAAAVSRAVSAHNRIAGAGKGRITEVLVHTGQHYDRRMSQVFFEELDIPEPGINLGVGSGPHGFQTGQMLIRIEQVLHSEKPDWLLVYGDTNSTLAGALAAVKLHIGVAHVEAGLRSYNRRMPEEHNRVLTDHCSALLFCPTKAAVDNLAREGIDRGVHRVGDVMYDSVLYSLALAKKRSEILSTLRLAGKAFALATVHRAENTDDLQRLQSILDGLKGIAASGLAVVLPLHPRTRKILGAAGLPTGAVQICEPLPYLDMLLLENSARVILTDSGGVQKEAFWMNVPCITLRDETEWGELVDMGANTLVGADTEKIVKCALRAAQFGFAGADNAYGDGHSAKAIIELLLQSRKDETGPGP